MVKIIETDFQAAYNLSLKIPEFAPNYYPKTIWKKRLEEKKYLCLIAKLDEKTVGFKIGYFIDSKIFYSWMGGVLPNWRKQGIAKALADFQEEKLVQKNIETIQLKTRNQHQDMLIMAIKRGFLITRIERKEERVLENRIFLEKKLL